MSETFGQRLKRLREAKGWTQNELESTAIPYTYGGIVHDIEGDRDGITLKMFRLLAKALGVSLDYLATGVELSPIADTPGKRIRQRRDELGWTVRDCSRHAAFCLESLLMVEADCDEWDLSGIANALGVTTDWVLTGAEPKFPPAPQAPDAEWFKGWDNPGPTVFPCDGDAHKVSCHFTVSKGYGQKVLEMIRTGRWKAD